MSSGEDAPKQRLTQPEIAQIDRLKEISRTFRQELDAVAALIRRSHTGNYKDADYLLSAARAHMQDACISACRAVAQPEKDC